MKIRGTQEHINQGLRMDARQCPVALALSEQVGGHASVGLNSACAGTYPNPQGFKLPRSAQRFISAFDHESRKAVEPFNFRLKS